MMYVCPELEKMPGREAIIETLSDPKNALMSRYDTTTGRFEWFFQIFSRKPRNTSDVFLHSNVLVKKYLASQHYSSTLRTNATVMAAYGIALTDYSGAGAYSFLHNYDTPAEHFSGFYFTVYTESGVILTKPVRFAGAVNRGEVLREAVINYTVNGRTSYHYQGETGYDYTIAANTDFVQPAIVDSTLKALALNKYKSMCKILEFASGLDCLPGDYCQYLTETYVILSRKPGPNGMNIFSAVLESSNTYTFAASSTLVPMLRLKNYNHNPIIAINSNNPPTVKINSLIVYHNGQFDVSILESADRTFSWGAGAFPSKANSTAYYIHCSGPGIDGTGVYGASTVSPAWDNVKQGWYNASGRVLYRVATDGSGNILPGSLCLYTDDLIGELYTTTTSEPDLSGLNILKQNGKWKIFASLNVSITAVASQLKMYLNNNRTDTNYQTRQQEPSSASGGQSYNAPVIWYNYGSAWTNWVNTMINMWLLNNKARWEHITNEEAEASSGYSYIGVGATDALAVTDITQITFSLSSGSWVAGSDIRIYKG